MLMEGSIIPGKFSENSTILPLYFPPPVKMYLHHAIPLSIILSNPGSMEWFYTNYLQICSLGNNAPYPDEYFQFFPHNFNWDGCYFLDVQWWYYDNVDTIIDTCKHWIKSGFYLDFDISESELPGTRGYKRFRNTHQCLIYGFDDGQKELYSINFDENSNFIIIRHSYSNFIKAFSYVISYLKSTNQYLREKYSLRILKVHDRKYDFDIPSLKNLFGEYLLSSNSSKSHYYSIFFEKKGYTAWGINVINYMVDYMKHNNGKMIDYRAFHGFWEHKCIMYDRINYLKEKGIIAADSKLLEEFKNIEHSAILIRNQIIKYNIVLQQSILDKIINKLEEIYQNERKIIEQVINLF